MTDGDVLTDSHIYATFHAAYAQYLKLQLRVQQYATDGPVRNILPYIWSDYTEECRHQAMSRSSYNALDGIMWLATHEGEHVKTVHELYSLMLRTERTLMKKGWEHMDTVVAEFGQLKRNLFVPEYVHAIPQQMETVTSTLTDYASVFGESADTGWGEASIIKVISEATGSNEQYTEIDYNLVFRSWPTSGRQTPASLQSRVATPGLPDPLQELLNSVGGANHNNTLSLRLPSARPSTASLPSLTEEAAALQDNHHALPDDQSIGLFSNQSSRTDDDFDSRDISGDDASQD